MPDITVIVPVWNGGSDIDRCLDALEAQTLARDRFEIVVVDNGSSDDTIERITRRPAIRLLCEARPGSYAARNAGLAATRSTYVAFTDADCRPSPGWLEAALRAAQIRPDAAIIGGPIELFSEHAGVTVAELYERTFAFRQEEVLADGRCATANWMSPRSVLDEVGGFDAGLKSGGDYALSQRIARSGGAVVFCREMVVDHPIRATLSALARKRRRTVGGRWTLLQGGAPIRSSFKRAIRHALGAARTIIASHDLRPGQKFRVLGLAAALSAVEVDEITRLARGKAATRA